MSSAPAELPTSECTKTVGGTAVGTCCHFPFTYRGVTYRECTSVGWSKPWCYTNAARTRWGECVVSGESLGEWVY